jgi:hypothetical protein
MGRQTKQAPKDTIVAVVFPFLFVVLLLLHSIATFLS